MKDRFDILVDVLNKHGLPARVVDDIEGDNLDNIDTSLVTIKYIEVKLQMSVVFRVIVDNEDGYAWCSERKIDYANGHGIDYTKSSLLMLCEPSGYAPGEEISMASDIHHVMFKYMIIGECLY